MIKIGEAYVDEACLAAIAPRGVEVDSYAIWLTTGQTVLTRAVREEVEAAVASLGFFHAEPEPVSESDTLPALTAAEMLELIKAQDRDAKWIAKDKDGYVYAYCEEPALVGAYWSTDGLAGRIRLQEEYSFIEWNNPEPTRISGILNR